jgi:cyclohexyl-isocyanide hydratase
MKKFSVCMVIFPDLTIQDFVGPYEVFNKAGCFETFIVSEQTGIVMAEGGLELKTSMAFRECPPCDILFVPGGRGVTSLINNRVMLNFLQQQGSTAQYITSVCTGSLLLAAAGLLKGYQATTHWRSFELLQLLGVQTVQERVVIDRNRITGGGITSGIDFGLILTAMIAGEKVAKCVQLILEYNPEPPFQCGSPATADPYILQRVSEDSQSLFDLRKRTILEFNSISHIS